MASLQYSQLLTGEKVRGSCLLMVLGHDVAYTLSVNVQTEYQNIYQPLGITTTNYTIPVKELAM